MASTIILHRKHHNNRLLMTLPFLIRNVLLVDTVFYIWTMPGIPKGCVNRFWFDYNQNAAALSYPRMFTSVDHSPCHPHWTATTTAVNCWWSAHWEGAKCDLHSKPQTYVGFPVLRNKMSFTEKKHALQVQQILALLVSGIWIAKTKIILIVMAIITQILIAQQY